MMGVCMCTSIGVSVGISVSTFLSVIPVVGSGTIRLTWSVARIVSIIFRSTTAGRKGVGGADIEHQAGDEGRG